MSEPQIPANLGTNAPNIIHKNTVQNTLAQQGADHASSFSALVSASFAGPNQNTPANHVTSNIIDRTLSNEHSQDQNEDTLALDFPTGQQDVNPDEYFEVTPGYFDPDKPLLLPTSHNLNALSSHLSGKIGELLNEYNIPKAPANITYNDHGELTFPSDYPYSQEFQQALDAEPAVAHELRTYYALASHNANLDQATSNISATKNYIDIVLTLDPDGQVTIERS